MTAANDALEWWRAFGEGRVDALWTLSSRPVRYMIARAIVADEVTSLAAGGDHDAATRLLTACQNVAVHGARSPGWQQLESYRDRFFAPVDMEPLIRSMRIFPRTEGDVGGYTQITFHPPDTPPMPWIVDVAHHTVVGFATVLVGSEDAGRLGERVANDPIALWAAVT